MKKNYFAPLLFFFLIISACKKESSIGADILPPSDLLNVRYTDTFTVQAKTLADTFLRTDKLAKNYLGVIDDGQYGFQKAAVVMELDRPNSIFDDTLGPFTLDSAVLFLKYNFVYGDTTVPQSFSVSTISNKINETSLYFSNNTSFPAGSQIGSLNNYYFKPSKKETTFPTDTTGTAGLMRININSFAAYSILNLGQTILRDSTQFKNAFPGIRIENSSASGKAMAELNLISTSSYMVIFYKDKNGTKRDMKLYTSLFRASGGILVPAANGINLFSSTVSPVVQTVINSGLVSDSVNYVLGQGGTTVKINLPTLNNIGKVAVNKAELVVTQIIQNGSKDMQLPTFLLLLKPNADGLIDALSTSEGVGILDTSGTDQLGNKFGVYKFAISKYVQNISKGTETNSQLYIATYRSGGSSGAVNSLNTVQNGTITNFGYSPSRVIIAGPNYSDPRYRMKLNLTYTLIQ